MSTQLRRRYTLEKYLALESSSDEKHEFFDGEVFAMSGASLAHEQIVANTIVSLRNSLRGRSCRILPSNVRVIKDSDGSWRYEEVNVSEQTLRLVALSCPLPLRDVYEGVEFPSAPLPPLERP